MMMKRAVLMSLVSATGGVVAWADECGPPAHSTWTQVVRTVAFDPMIGPASNPVPSWSSLDADMVHCGRYFDAISTYHCFSGSELPGGPYDSCVLAQLARSHDMKISLGIWQALDQAMFDSRKQNIDDIEAVRVALQSCAHDDPVDGTVGVSDLLMLLERWGQCP